jgi:hypothetical protein
MYGLVHRYLSATSIDDWVFEILGVCPRWYARNEVLRLEAKLIAKSSFAAGWTVLNIQHVGFWMEGLPTVEQIEQRAWKNSTSATLSGRRTREVSVK